MDIVVVHCQFFVAAGNGGYCDWLEGRETSGHHHANEEPNMENT
jgi:hypothetical protein